MFKTEHTFLTKFFLLVHEDEWTFVSRKANIVSRESGDTRDIKCNFVDQMYLRRKAYLTARCETKSPLQSQLSTNLIALSANALRMFRILSGLLYSHEHDIQFFKSTQLY